MLQGAYYNLKSPTSNTSIESVCNTLIIKNPLSNKNRNFYWVNIFFRKENTLVGYTVLDGNASSEVKSVYLRTSVFFV